MQHAMEFLTGNFLNNLNKSLVYQRNYRTRPSPGGLVRPLTQHLVCVCFNISDIFIVNGGGFSLQEPRLAQNLNWLQPSLILQTAASSPGGRTGQQQPLGDANMERSGRLPVLSNIIFRLPVSSFQGDCHNFRKNLIMRRKICFCYA